VSLSAGTRIGPYEVTAQLGEGGMGQVYRATDTNLKRTVAIKVLPEAVATDVERLTRFQREAEMLARLNHRNIAQIHGLERSEGTIALVMELVDGDTLADRISRGPLPLDEVLGIAQQIADALEAAHEQGIIHRDLKPANVKVRDDGTVKVLDFGLAKLTERGLTEVGHNLPDSPTITSPALVTGVGVLIGTAAYMSPEQVRSKPADRRSDVWAYGCVLYEMLTARRAFDGEDVADTLGAVTRLEPDWSALPANIPASLRVLLRRCLTKDSRRRLADVADARLEIEDTLAGLSSSTPAAVAPVASSWLQSRLAVAVTASVAVLSLSSVVWLASRPVRPLPETHLEIGTPPTTDPTSFAVSPDGRRIVFAATRTEARSELWLRSLDDGEVRPLEGTRDGGAPFWSPDGRSIGFFAGGKLHVIDIATGAARVVADAPGALGGTWNADGVVLYPRSGVGGLVRMRVEGGPVEVVTKIEPGERHSYPHFLPDGRTFLYYSSGAPELRGVYAARLGELRGRRILDVETPATFVPPTHVLFMRQGRLWAQEMDTASLSLVREPFPVGHKNSRDLDVLNVVGVSASRSGTLAYRRAPSDAGQRQLVWVDRTGTKIETVDASIAGTSIALAPDGRQMAASRGRGNVDIWLSDLVRGVSSRFTSSSTVDSHPTWSPDGTRLVYQRFFTETGAGDIYQRQVNEAGPEEPLLVDGRGKIPTGFSPDGGFLLFKVGQTGGKTEYKWDIWALPLTGDRKPFPVVSTTADERDAEFSPNGRWIIYQSDESGQFEVYLRPFMAPGNQVQVSVSGGAQPRWHPNGREIFYIALDGRLTAVAVRWKPTGPPELGKPEPLFLANSGPVVQAISRPTYVVSPDGRFLMTTLVDAVITAPIEMILNFNPIGLTK
jgi:serine/threonine protein kinase/Tol biopolymer transport system component